MENEKSVKITEKKQPKKNVLGILSVIFAGVALIGSRIPPFNVISIIFAVAAIIIGIISFVFVLMKKSNYLALPIIGIVVSITSVALVNVVNTVVSDSLSDKDRSQKVTSPSDDDSIIDDFKFNTPPLETEEYNDYKLGDTLLIDKRELTVTDIQRDYKTKCGKPQDGQEYVKVTLKLENKSDKIASVNPFNFKIQDSQGVIEDYSFSGSVGQEDPINDSELAPNGFIKGSLIFEVPKGDNNLVFIYKPDLFVNKQIKIKL